MTPAEEIQYAVTTYGRPLWSLHVSKQLRDKVPLAEIGAMLKVAEWSTGFNPVSQAHRDFDKWIASHVGEIVSADSLAEVSTWSAGTCRKYIKNHAGTFRAVKRGYWEIRDPQADRIADKK